MSIKLFWNNICLVTKLEEEFINAHINESPQFLDVTYFGLGRPQSMLQYFKENNQLLCDYIVSTDTDIFHDKNYNHMFNDFTPLDKFITIPLVIIYNENNLGSLKPPKSFSDLFQEDYKGKFAFGGPHNSAGKSLIKSIWYTYGIEKAKDFIKSSIITSMPAAAFNKVMTGAVPIAIVPTIFSLRAGISSIQMVWPEDGAIPIHSYIGSRTTLSNEINTFFSTNLLGKEFQQLLVEKAAIIPHHPDVPYPIFNNVKSYSLMDPDWNFLKTLDHSLLYQLLAN